MPRANRRTDALDATIELVVEEGVAPTMEAIADAADMTRQALYHHFDNAEGLFVAMVERVGERHGLADWLERIRIEEDPDARLGAYLDFLAAYWDEVGAIAIALAGAGQQSPQARAAWDDREAGQRALARGVVRRFADAGRLRTGWSADAAGDVLYALASPFHHQALRETCGWSRDEYRSYLEASVRSLLIDG